jgi:hypothetical protein
MQRKQLVTKASRCKEKGSRVVLTVNVSSTPALHLSGQEVTSTPAAVAAFKAVIQLADRALLKVSNYGTQFPNTF